MKRVRYIRKGPVVVLKTLGVPLVVGHTTFREQRWVVGSDMFEKLQKQNPNVEFVRGAPSTRRTSSKRTR